MFQIPLDCTGCHACANICPAKCIMMKKSEAGFLIPEIDQSSCINCGQCEKVCPVIHIPEISTQTVAYAMKNRSQNERVKSTSEAFFRFLQNMCWTEKGYLWGSV